VPSTAQRQKSRDTEGANACGRVLCGDKGTTLVQQSKVAVIGCGAWGKNLVRNFYDLGVLTIGVRYHAYWTGHS
jgi:cell division GTPase FtsZ